MKRLQPRREINPGKSVVTAAFSPFARAERHHRTMTWAVLLMGALTLGACAGLESARPVIIRNTGLGDRCADYMRLSYPGARIDVRVSHVEVANTKSGGLGLMIVDVQGVRPDIPASGGFLANEVAARCRFENGILTQFRWTSGPFR